MYIVHFMKYEDDVLTDAWTSEDYFKTECDADRWLTQYDGQEGVFEPDAMTNNCYEYKKDDIRIEAEIKYVYEFLGI